MNSRGFSIFVMPYSNSVGIVGVWYYFVLASKAFQLILEFAPPVSSVAAKFTTTTRAMSAFEFKIYFAFVARLYSVGIDLAYWPLNF